VYGETTALPAVTVKVGKFYGAFGKQNILHTHIFPFIDRPLISSELLGEGLNAAGASASVLLPLPFFSEFTAQGFGNFVSLARWRNLFELGEAATLEAGVSAVNRWAYGVDLTFKHRPTDRGQGRRFNLAGEWMAGSLEGFTVTPTSDGLPTRGFDVYAQYEFIPRFYFQYRFDDLISNSTLRHGLLLGYAPSEFTVMRIQTDHASTSGAGIENRVLIQVSYTIGFHPSHDY
jgi:hypothetical protein